MATLVEFTSSANIIIIIITIIIITKIFYNKGLIEASLDSTSSDILDCEDESG